MRTKTTPLGVFHARIPAREPAPMAAVSIGSSAGDEVAFALDQGDAFTSYLNLHAKGGIDSGTPTAPGRYAVFTVTYVEIADDAHTGDVA